MRQLLLVTLFFALSPTNLPAQSREEKVRNDKQKVEAAGYWIYNDFPRAFAEAKQAGKPMVVVLRCIPCEECVKLDDDLIDADERMKPLLEQFVRVRVVSTNGLDLSLFQFDTDQSFAVFLLNAEGTIYGRFGTRSHRSEWLGDVSVDGLAKALEGALVLHRQYPENKAELAGKRGAKPEFASPEKFPSLKDKYKPTIDYQGKVVQSCIHCHQIGDAARELAIQRDKSLPEATLFPYPHPKTVGLTLDPKQRATVLKVEPGSDADEAGFEPGDEIQRLAGQPLLSIADVQWVLHNTSPDGATLKADVIRQGKPHSITLTLPKAWRHRDDISWRVSSWGLRRAALGGMKLANLTEEARKKWQLPENTTGLLVEHVGQYPPHNRAQQAGIRKGDILLSYDSRSDLLREADLFSYALSHKKAGQKVPLTVLRDGTRREITLQLP